MAFFIIFSVISMAVVFQDFHITLVNFCLAIPIIPAICFVLTSLYQKSLMMFFVPIVAQA